MILLEWIGGNPGTAPKSLTTEDTEDTEIWHRKLRSVHPIRSGLRRIASDGLPGPHGYFWVAETVANWVLQRYTSLRRAGWGVFYVPGEGKNDGW